MRYQLIPNFDFEQWEDEISGGNRSKKAKVSPDLVRVILQSMDGSAKRKDLVEEIMKIALCGETLAYDQISKMLKDGELCQVDGMISIPVTEDEE